MYLLKEVGVCVRLRRVAITDDDDDVWMMMHRHYSLSLLSFLLCVFCFGGRKVDHFSRESVGQTLHNSVK